MLPRLLHLLATASINPHAGDTGLSALTSVVRRLTQSNPSQSILPLFAAVTPLPIRQRPEKIHPMAIGQALRRLVTRALLPAELLNSAEFSVPEQLANGAGAGLDEIVHGVQMLAERYGHRRDVVRVSINAKNTFNIARDNSF